MRKAKKKRLEEKGWRFGSAKDFWSLSDKEAAYIELKTRLAEGVRQQREQAGLAQLESAAKARSSQLRVAKIEAVDPSVSLDLLIHSLINVGLSDRELSKLIATRRAA